MIGTIITAITLVALPVAGSAASTAGVRHREVDYKAGKTELKGYLALPAGKGRHPAVLVVHEWWGQNAYARKRADMLAGLGYVAFALDMYGQGKLASHPKDAAKFAAQVHDHMDEAEQRFLAAEQLVKSLPEVDPARIAAIGYCFGGGIVLEMARRGVDLDGVVSFHGSLGTSAPAKPGVVKAQVLVYNGAEDPFTKPEQIAAFKKEMNAAGVKFEFVNLPGAKHSFTNPASTELGRRFKLPLAYSAEADRVSWAGMKKFLARIFKR